MDDFKKEFLKFVKILLFAVGWRQCLQAYPVAKVSPV